MLVFFVAACSSGSYTHLPGITIQSPQFDEPGEKAGSLSVNLTEEARKEVTENFKFDQGHLHETIRRALEVNNLLSANPDPSLPSVVVTVTSVRVRSNFSAVMFGFMAGDDHIDGDVLVHAANGSELQRFSVSASYALGGLAGGQDSARMGWLYESFAERMMEELTGVSHPVPWTQVCLMRRA